MLDMQMPGDGWAHARRRRFGKLPRADDDAARAAYVDGSACGSAGICQRRLCRLPDQADQARATPGNALLRVISGAKPAKKARDPKLDPNSRHRLPLRVLLCDDNAINQKVAMRLLQQMGYQPDLAANGIEALAALEAASTT